jgi:zinc protease
VVNRPNSPQSYIYGGILTPMRPQDADIVDLDNANNALGGNFLARLNMNLRETKGWSYGVRGTVRLTENAVAYTVAAPVQADRTGDSLKELITDIDEFLGDKGVTEAELNRAVIKETRELPGQFETSDAVLSAMQSNALYDRPDDYHETLADHYSKQTRESLDAAARRALAAGKFIWVIVGDVDKIKSQLDALDMPIEYRGYEASDTAVNSDSSSDDSADGGE